MLKGIYSAASGMVAEMLRTDTIANNLANVNTNGYKKDIAVTQSFGDLLMSKIEGKETPTEVGGVGTGAYVAEVAPTFTAGAYRDTGNPLDVAIEGAGFFTVQTPQGIRYTRDGSFSFDAEGYLVTHDGYQVLGEQGPIQNTGKINQTFVIDQSGQVFAGKNLLDRLKVVGFPDSSTLQKEGNSLWQATSTGQDLGEATKLRQGSLESSNVNPIGEMVNLITATRAYEINQKIIQTQDDSLSKSVNDVGRVG